MFYLVFNFMNENIYTRQDNKVVAVADSTKKESSSKESTTLSERDAKTIRKFLQELKPYEADMRYILDTYIRADDSKLVNKMADMTLVELLLEGNTTTPVVSFL